MEIELGRWQLAYETISTLITSVANCETGATLGPLLLNYPIDANEIYLPLLSENRRPVYSPDGRHRRSPECAGNNGRRSVQDDSRASWDVAETLLGNADSPSVNETYSANRRTMEEDSGTSFNWATFCSNQRCNPQNSSHNVRSSSDDRNNQLRRNHSLGLFNAANENLRAQRLLPLPCEYLAEANASSENGGMQTEFINRTSSISQHGSPHPNLTSAEPRDFRNEISTNPINVCDLFHRLMKNFYTETFLWMYVNTLIHPGSRRTLNRIRFLALETGRSLQQATYDMLTGFLNGYQHSRLPLLMEIDRSLREISSEPFQQRRPSDFSSQSAECPERGAHLRQLSLELGAVLIPRQMLRSFGTVVREVTMQTIASPRLQEGRFTRQFSDLNHPLSHLFNSGNFQRAFPGYGSSPWHLIPPPPPPYPGFLLHFCAMLDQPTLPTEIPEYYDLDDDVDDYEDLLELADRLGDAKPSGLTDTLIQQLPSFRYKETGVSMATAREPLPGQETCVICLDRYTAGQRLRLLPCGHDYHDICIDRWLKIKNACPVCRSLLELPSR